VRRRDRVAAGRRRQQIRADGRGGAAALVVQRPRQGLRIAFGAVVMDHDVGAGGVQGADQMGADAPGPARHQGGLAGQRAGAIVGFAHG
jgi:hypothetical protein